MVLDTTLPCVGQECLVETVRTVQVGGVWYEYLRVPCVALAFFENPTRAAIGTWRQSCLNPQAEAAGAACCDSLEKTSQVSWHECQYLTERVTLATANARCAAKGKVVCHKMKNTGAGGCGYSEFPTWLSRPCTVQVQVYADGLVQLAHRPTAIRAAEQNSKNHFGVRWAGGVFPRPSDSCYAGNLSSSCYVDDTYSFAPSCVCDFTLNTAAVFTGAVPSAAQVRDQLLIANAPPSSFDEGTYVRCITSACNASAPHVRVFVNGSSTGGDFNEATVFEVQVNGSAAFFRNVQSTVHVGNLFSFRNPPHFIAFDHPEYRDGYYETEALLSHLVMHANTAPFIAYRLIQRLVASNPSPRYVGVVATAFRDGSYGGHTYSGKYGDLASTVAASAAHPAETSPSQSP